MASPLPPLPFEGRAIDRLSAPSPSDLSKRRDQPAVLGECLEDWPLYRTFREIGNESAHLAMGPQADHAFLRKLEHIQTIFGDRVVSSTRIPPEHHGHVGYIGDSMRMSFARPRKVPFVNVAKQITTAVAKPEDGAVYVLGISIAEYVPELLDHVGTLSVLDGGQKPNNVWIGSGGHVVPLHYDLFENFICMLTGRKRITLLPPKILQELYPVPLDFGMASLVQLREPNWAQFPKLRQGLEEARVVVLEPGEVLYIPPCWWHHVESFDFNVMVNAWIDVATTEDVNTFKTGLEDAAIALADATDEDRARTRAWFIAAVESGGITAPPTTTHTVAALAQNAHLVASFGHEHKTMATQLYDHLVFRVNGDPFPTLPGEHARMVQRLREHRTERLEARTAGTAQWPRR